MKDGEIISGASSYSYCEGSIDITIETKPEYKRQGLALACASKVILGCMQKALEVSFMIYIEKAKIGDAEKIVEVKRLAYTDEDIRFGGGRGDYLKYIGDVDFISWCMNRYLLYKIMLGGIIVGTFWLDHETDDRLDHFELQDFCIIPEYQNKGYGAKAMELMEKLHQNIIIWSLGTATFSIRNQHLYERMGYKKVGQTEENVIYEKIINHQ